MSIARIKGFADMFPPQSDNFTRMDNCARDIFGPRSSKICYW